MNFSCQRESFQYAFFDILKFSLKERFRGQRQRKVDDMQIFFTFIPTCFYCSCPHCLTIKLNILYFENDLLALAYEGLSFKSLITFIIAFLYLLIKPTQISYYLATMVRTDADRNCILVASGRMKSGRKLN